MAPLFWKLAMQRKNNPVSNRRRSPNGEQAGNPSSAAAAAATPLPETNNNSNQGVYAGSWNPGLNAGRSNNNRKFTSSAAAVAATPLPLANNNSNQGGNAASSQNPGLNSRRSSNKRKLPVGEAFGQNFGIFYWINPEDPKGSRFNPIELLEDSDSSSDSSGNISSPNQESNGRHNVRNVRARLSSSGQPSSHLNNDSNGCAIMLSNSNDSEDSDPEVDQHLDPNSEDHSDPYSQDHNSENRHSDGSSDADSEEADSDPDSEEADSGHNLEDPESEDYHSDASSEDPDSDPESDHLDHHPDLDSDPDSEADLDPDSDPDSSLRMPQSKHLRALIQNQQNQLSSRPAAHVAPPRSNQLVGPNRGANSRTANPSVRSQLSYADRLGRVPESYERYQQLRRTGNASASGRSGNAPSASHVQVPARNAETNADANTSAGRRRGTGISFCFGRSLTDVRRSSAVAAGTTVHPSSTNKQHQSLSGAGSRPLSVLGTNIQGSNRASANNSRRLPMAGAGRNVCPSAINNQPQSLSSAGPRPLSILEINGQGSNHASASNSQRLPIPGAGASRQPISISETNDRGTARAGRSNNQPLPVPPAAVSPWPFPVQVAPLANATSDTWPLPPPEDTWPMPAPMPAPVQEDNWPLPMTAAGSSSQFISFSGTNGRGRSQFISFSGTNGRGRSQFISFSGTNGRGRVSARQRGAAFLQQPAGSRGAVPSMPELESALGSIRRSERVRAEGTVVVDHSSGFSSEAEDEYEDDYEEMRLDIDNMSYEELLALERRIGDVSTGLTAAATNKCMKLRKLGPRTKISDPCCIICQEEFQRADPLGSLKSCGHTFHPDCIRQWLKVKGECPICKRRVGSFK